MGEGTAEQTVTATPGTGVEPTSPLLTAVMHRCCASAADHCALTGATGKHCAPVKHERHDRLGRPATEPSETPALPIVV